MLVLVRSRSVMVIRVIVLRVLVHVHRRNHGGRDNQGVREQESNETPHDDQSITVSRLFNAGPGVGL